MDEPIYSQTTERIYRSLPEFYRVADEQQDWVLKRWLSGIADQQGAVDTLLDRIDYIDPIDRIDDELEGTTGESLTALATDIDQTGVWTSTFSGVKSDAAGAALAHELYLKGGTYNLYLDYQVGPDRGIANVIIDGAITIVIDQYAASYSAQTYTLLDSPLAEGYHSFRFERTGTKNALSSGFTVEAHAFRGTNVTASPDLADTSDLVDPDTADDAWLDWLGQLVGVQNLDPELSLRERRDAVRYAASGWRAGTKLAVANAAKSVLTGTRYAHIYDHSTSLQDQGTAGAWDVLVVTRNSETPDPEIVLEAIRRKRAKPAGVVLHHQAYEATWDTLEATYLTWNAIESTGSWDRMQETMT